MTSLEEPTRWTDMDELPESLLSDLSTYRDHGPSEAQVSRMLEALAEPARSGRAAEIARSSDTRLWKWGGAIVTAALVGLISWNALFGSPAETPTPTRTEVPPQAAPARPPRMPTIVEPNPNAPTTVVEPTKAEEIASQGTVKQRTRIQGSAKPNSDPAAELSILTRARRLLASAPEQSLALTEEHRSHYPKGVFAEERELLAVEALVKLARPADAQTRGRVFLRTHPGSAHGERVRVLLEPSP